MINICTVDDNQVIRDRIRKILSSESDMEITCEADSGKKAMEQLENNSVNILILDFYLPDTTAIDLVAKIKQLYSSVRIIILSSISQGFLVRKLLAEGVSRFVSKDDASEILVEVIREVSAG